MEKLTKDVQAGKNNYAVALADMENMRKAKDLQKEEAKLLAIRCT